MGCQVTAHMNEGTVEKVEGNACARGATYAASECSNPTRMLTTTIQLEGGMLPVAPIRSAQLIPMDMLLACMDVINRTVCTAPIRMGDVVIQNILGSGVDMIATRTINARAEVESRKAVCNGSFRSGHRG